VRGAAGIDKQHIVLVFELGTMGVTADDRVHSGPARIEIQPVSVVQHAQPQALNFHDIKNGQGGRPVAGIHISPDGRYRGDAPQCGQNIRAADITGMHDPTNRLKKVADRGMKNSVRVGNYSDPVLLLHSVLGDHARPFPCSFLSRLQLRFPLPAFPDQKVIKSRPGKQTTIRILTFLTGSAKIVFIYSVCYINKT
jgi:hypothetical protein